MSTNVSHSAIVPKAMRSISSLLLATLIVVPAWPGPSASRLRPAPTSPTPQTIGVVANGLSSPVYVNLYWDSTWDADNKSIFVPNTSISVSLPKASLDAFTAAMLSSSYFGGLAEYGVGAPSFAGGFLPAAACPQKAPPMVGFYDPFKPSIIGFLNCELQHGGIPQGPQVVYNLILPSGTLESDLFGNRTICGSTSPATAWHFHQTPYSPETTVGIAALTVGGGVPPVEAVLGVLALFRSGPIYTIESADSRCGNFTHNLLHEMVEAASDPFLAAPNVMQSINAIFGNSEIADICENVTPTMFAFVPPKSTVFLGSGPFTTAATVNVPLYWSNAAQHCVPGFTNTTTPTPVPVTFAKGGYPITPGSYSFTINGRGFGTLPASANLTPSPYVEFLNDTRHSRIGNSLNGDPAGIQIASWTDTSISVTGALGGDSYSFWVCNPGSALCAWRSMPAAVYGVSPNGAPCLSSTPIMGTITGANFYAVRSVRMDGNQNLVFTPQSLSQITATIPVSLGLHVIDVDAFGGSSVSAGPVFGVTPQLSVTICPTTDGKSCTSFGPQGRPLINPAIDIVTVTSCGSPLAGATVSVSGQPTNTAVTNASGIAVVSHLLCFAPGSQVPKVARQRCRRANLYRVAQQSARLDTSHSASLCPELI